MAKKPTKMSKIFDIIQSLERAKNQIDDLKNEFQNWHDSLPENLQDGEKAEKIQSAIDTLDEHADAVDQAISEISYCWET